MLLPHTIDEKNKAGQNIHQNRKTPTGSSSEDLVEGPATAETPVLPDSGDPRWPLVYLPPAVVGEDLITGQVQLVPLQQKLQLPIPVVLFLLVGAEGYKKAGKEQAEQRPTNERFRPPHMADHQSQLSKATLILFSWNQTLIPLSSLLATPSMPEVHNKGQFRLQPLPIAHSHRLLWHSDIST